MKKVFSLVLALVLTLGACCVGIAEGTELPKKVAFITLQSLSAPFMQLCHNGIDMLAADGWECTDYELAEASESADAIRTAAADGCSVIVVMFDDLCSTAEELSEELAAQYPDLTIFAADSYYAQNAENVVNIICDSWEASFLAGYVAAQTTEKDAIGFIGAVDAMVIHRFAYGFENGVKYADNGKEVIISYVGVDNDSLKGQELAKAMFAENDIDTIFQAASLSGLGVIQECIDQGKKCIGCDTWQGGTYGQDTVYWSAIKAIDDAIYMCCTAAQQGKLEELVGTGSGRYFYYDASEDASLYAQEDLEIMAPELQEKIQIVIDGMKDGSIDVYAGYDEYRFTGL